MFYTNPVRFAMRSVAVLLVLGAAVYAFADGRSSGGSDPFAFLGFSLIPPLFAQTTTPDAITFFENNGGLSAYAQLDPADRAKIDLDKLVTDVFTEVVEVGDNYIIGKIVIREPFPVAPRYLELSVYADNDGWILASSPAGQDGAEMLTFYQDSSCGSHRPGTGLPGVTVSAPPFGSGLTALECAIGIVAFVFDATIPENTQWYHWEFSDATNLVVGSILVTRSTPMKNLFFAIPTGIVWKDASISRILCRSAVATASFDGTQIADCATTPHTSLEFPFPTLGDTHTIHLVMTDGSFSRRSHIGVILVYKSP